MISIIFIFLPAAPIRLKSPTHPLHGVGKTLTADLYFNRGNNHGDLNQHEQAIADFSQAIRLKPQYVEAYYNRGNACLDLKRYEQAISDYSEAIRLKPEFAAAYYQRGVIYDDLGDSEKALADFTEAIISTAFSTE